MNLLSIELSPEGKFRLHWPGYFVDFPRTEKGMELLHHVLFSYSVESRQKAALFATDGSPSQSMVNSWLEALGEGGTQLAGDSKRWEEVEKATGVKVRRIDAKGFEKEVSLKDLDL